MRLNACWGGSLGGLLRGVTRSTSGTGRAVACFGDEGLVWGGVGCVFVGFAMIVVDAGACSFVFGPGCVLFLLPIVIGGCCGWFPVL